MPPSKPQTNPSITLPYRLATPLLLIFALAHTIGGLLVPYDYGAVANTVLSSMKSVQFNFNGSTCTFHGFHMGFGLMVTVFMLLSAGIANILAEKREGKRSADGEEALKRRLATMLVVAWLPMPVLSWWYFFIGPVVFSSAIMGCVGWGWWRMSYAKLGDGRG